MDQNLIAEKLESIGFPAQPFPRGNPASAEPPANQGFIIDTIFIKKRQFLAPCYKCFRRFSGDAVEKCCQLPDGISSMLVSDQRSRRISVKGGVYGLGDKAASIQSRRAAANSREMFPGLTSTKALDSLRITKQVRSPDWPGKDLCGRYLTRRNA